MQPETPSVTRILMTHQVSLNQLRSKARRLKAANPDLGLIVVDYIGLMPGDGRQSRQEQV